MLGRMRLGGFAGGLNPLYDPTQIDPRQAQLLQGWRTKNGALVRRPEVVRSLDYNNTHKTLEMFSVGLSGSSYLVVARQQTTTGTGTQRLDYWDPNGAGNWVGIKTNLQGYPNDIPACAGFLGFMYFGNLVDGLYKWGGANTTATRVVYEDVAYGNVPSALALLPFADRLFLFYTLEDGAICPQRVRWSSINSTSYWLTPDAGFGDLTDDDYPITGAAVVSGRMVVFKGNSAGGSISVGSRTGVTALPVQFETLNPGTGIGCFAPRTVVPISANLLAFLGHDDLYLFDGVSLQPFGGAVVRRILDNMNLAAARKAFAYYDAVNGEYNLCVPLTASTDPTDRYVFSLREKVWTGYEPISFMAGCRHTDTALVSTTAPTGEDVRWMDWNKRWQDETRHWDDLGTETGGGAGSGKVPDTYRAYVIMGDQVGDLWKTVSTIGNETFTSTYISKDFTFEGLQVGARVLTPDDMKALRSVTLVWKDLRAWTPQVYYSLDGGLTWYQISDGVQVGTGSGKIVRTVYARRPRSGYPVTSQRITIKIVATSATELHDMELEVGYAGHALY